MRTLPATRRASGSPAARWIPTLLLALSLGSTSASAGPPEGPAATTAGFPAPGAWAVAAKVKPAEEPAGRPCDLVYLICESSGRARFGLATPEAMLCLNGTWTVDGATLTLASTEMPARRIRWSSADAGGLVLRVHEGEDATDQPFARVTAPPELSRMWVDAEAKVELELRSDHTCRWREPTSNAPGPLDRVGIWFAGDLIVLGGPAGHGITAIASGTGTLRGFHYELVDADSLRLRKPERSLPMEPPRTLRAAVSPWARFDASAGAPATKDAEPPEGSWLAIRRGDPTGEVLRCEAGGRFTRGLGTVVEGTWSREKGAIRFVGAEGSGASPGSTGVAKAGQDGSLTVTWSDGAAAEPTRYERSRWPASLVGRWHVEEDTRSKAKFNLGVGGTLSWDDGDLEADGTPRPALEGHWHAWGDMLVLEVVSNGERRPALFALPFVQADRMLCDAGGMGLVLLLVRDEAVAPGR